MEQESLFARMILHHQSIICLENSHIVFSVTLSGNRLEEVGVFVSKLDPTDGASLLPILLLIIQQSEEVLFDDLTKVAFRNSERSYVFEIIQLSKSFVCVFNCHREPRDILVPHFELLS